MRNRLVIFWVIWLLLVISTILLFSILAANGAARHCSPSQPTQGAGAQDLIRKEPFQSPTLMSLPKPLLLPMEPVTYYFAATAKDNSGLESDFSNEVSLTTSNALTVVVLAWDPSPGTNIITNYSVYFGPASGTYTNVQSAGTNLTLAVRLQPPPLTNVVIRVWSQNATNLQWRPLGGYGWSLLGETNWTATNPAPRLWRALGTSPTRSGKAFVSASWQ